ncbi:MAG: DUF397 domain-containing protein [Pseudonocardiales bacterium]
MGAGGVQVPPATRPQATRPNCVEVAVAGQAVAVRDSKHRTGGTVVVSQPAWSAFTSALRCAGAHLGFPSLRWIPAGPTRATQARSATPRRRGLTPRPGSSGVIHRNARRENGIGGRAVQRGTLRTR